MKTAEPSSSDVQECLRSIEYSFAIGKLPAPWEFKSSRSGRIDFKLYPGKLPRSMRYTAHAEDVDFDGTKVLASGNSWICPICGEETQTIFVFETRLLCGPCSGLPMGEHFLKNPYRNAYPEIFPDDPIEIGAIYTAVWKYVRLVSDPPVVFAVKFRKKGIGQFIANPDRLPLAGDRISLVQGIPGR